MVVFRSITSKLTVLFALVMVVPIGILMYSDYHNTLEILKEEAFDEMSDLRDYRKNAIENYINDLREEVMLLAETDVVVEFTNNLRAHFFKPGNLELPIKYRDELFKRYKSFYKKLEKDLGVTIDSNRITKMLEDSLTAYYQYRNFNERSFFDNHPNSDLIQSSHHELANIANQLGFTDIYIVDNSTGYIMYSIPKKADFAINLMHHSLEDTFARKVGIIDLFMQVRELKNNNDVVMSDYFLYRPSFDQPAAFLGTPIRVDGGLNASLLVQLPVTELDNIARGLSENSTYSDTWISGLESYVISSDKKMRTNSKIVFKNQTYFQQKTDSLISNSALKKIANHYQTTILMFELSGTVIENAIIGKNGTESSENYLGEKVLSSYTSLDIPNVDWLLITEQTTDHAFEPIRAFVKDYYRMAILIVVMLILIALVISRIVSQPILKLVDSVQALREENFDFQINMPRTDELGILAQGLNKATKTIGLNRKKIQTQYDLLQEREKEIKDSIQYAKLIQQSILPPIEDLHSFFEDVFVFYRPKDIVSGDFYWWGGSDSHCVVAAVDCTGHGVPGALLSMKANSILRKIVEEKHVVDPAQILEQLDADIQLELRQEVTQNSDGMDISVISVELKKNTIVFSGAHNSIFHWSSKDKSLNEIKATRRSVGGIFGELDKKFESISIEVQKGDAIYMMSDGVIDQIGGMSERKLMKKNLTAFLHQNAHYPCNDQYKKVEEFFEQWMHPADEIHHDQLDDMLLLCLRIR